MAKKEDLSSALAALTELTPEPVGAPAAYSASVNKAAETPAVVPVEKAPEPKAVKAPEPKRRGRKPKAEAAEKVVSQSDARLVRIHLTEDEIEQASMYLPISGLAPKGAMSMPLLITYLARIGLQEVLRAAKSNIQKGVL